MEWRPMKDTPFREWFLEGRERQIKIGNIYINAQEDFLTVRVVKIWSKLHMGLENSFSEGF